jgi:predicted dehydrogenase
MRAIGVAVVGLGVGAAHARAYAALGSCQVRWLHDLDPRRAEALAVELDSGEAASSLEQILADPEVSIVSIATYDDAHFAQTLAALEAGKHVFVEKPLCRTHDELRSLHGAWRRGGGTLHLRSNLVLRAAPLNRWLRAQLAAGAFGSLYAFDGDYLYGRIEKITEGWRSGVDGYSVLLGGGVHLVDLMLWLTGERPRSVTAAGNRIATAGTAFRYDDFVAATYRFDSGLIGRVSANFGSVHRHQHVVRLFGTAASLVSDDAGARLSTERDGGGPARPVEEDAVPPGKGVLVEEFVQAVRDGDDPGPAAEHEFSVVAACLAADRARKEGKEIDVDYV